MINAITCRPGVAPPPAAPAAAAPLLANASDPRRPASVATSITPASQTTRSSSNLTCTPSGPTGLSSCTMKVTSCRRPRLLQSAVKALHRRSFSFQNRTEPCYRIGGSGLRPAPLAPSASPSRPRTRARRLLTLGRVDAKARRPRSRNAPRAVAVARHLGTRALATCAGRERRRRGRRRLAPRPVRRHAAYRPTVRRRSGAGADAARMRPDPDASSRPAAGRGRVTPRRVVLLLLAAALVAAVLVPRWVGSSGWTAAKPPTTKPPPARQTPPKPPHRLIEEMLGTLPAPLQDAAAAPLGRSRLVLLGGLSAADTSTNGILAAGAAGSHSLGVLPTALHDAAAVRLGRSVYLFGGGDGIRQLDAIVRVDPRTGRATVVGRLPAPSSDQAAAAIGRTAYVVGGYTGTRWLDTIVAWRPGSSPRIVGRLPSPREVCGRGRRRRPDPRRGRLAAVGQGERRAARVRPLDRQRPSPRAAAGPDDARVRGGARRSRVRDRRPRLDRRHADPSHRRRGRLDRPRPRGRSAADTALRPRGGRRRRADRPRRRPRASSAPRTRSPSSSRDERGANGGRPPATSTRPTVPGCSPALRGRRGRSCTCRTARAARSTRSTRAASGSSSASTSVNCHSTSSPRGTCGRSTSRTTPGTASPRSTRGRASPESGSR